MSITDSASAARYGLQDASLSRAGDDGSSPTFVAPDSAGILAGEAAMVPSSVSSVLQDNPSTTAAGAYPLPMLTYGATTPGSLQQADRQSYSALIRYAAGPGQVSGPLPGDLPAGYVPLPATLSAQAVSAAATVLNPPNQASASTPSAPSVGSSASASSSFPADSTSSTSTPAATSTPADTTTKKPLGSTVLAAVRTKGVPIGAVRWALLIVLLIGLVSIVASFIVGRRPGGAGPIPVPPVTEGPS
jgi:hypothetical protein